jgi:hypothetical protein
MSKMSILALKLISRLNLSSLAGQWRLQWLAISIGCRSWRPWHGLCNGGGSQLGQLKSCSLAVMAGVSSGVISA